MNKVHAVHRHSIFIAALLVSLFAVPVSAQTLIAAETVKRQSWRQTLALYGTLTSPRSAQLTPRVAGLVAQTHVEAGDQVEIADALEASDAPRVEACLTELERYTKELAQNVLAARKTRA